MRTVLDVAYFLHLLTKAAAIDATRSRVKCMLLYFQAKQPRQAPCLCDHPSLHAQSSIPCGNEPCPTCLFQTHVRHQYRGQRKQMTYGGLCAF
jgi:hypothetical protein